MSLVFPMSQGNDKGRGKRWSRLISSPRALPGKREAPPTGGSKATAASYAARGATVSVAELRGALQTEIESLRRRDERLSVSLSLAARAGSDASRDSSFDRARFDARGRPPQLPRYSRASPRHGPGPAAEAPCGNETLEIPGDRAPRGSRPERRPEKPGHVPRSTCAALRRAVSGVLQRLRPGPHAAPIAQAGAESDGRDADAVPPESRYITPLRRRYLALQRAMARDELALRRQVHERLRGLPAELRVPVTHHSLGAFIKQPAFTRWLSSAESQSE